MMNESQGTHFGRWLSKQGTSAATALSAAAGCDAAATLHANGGCAFACCMPTSAAPSTRCRLQVALSADCAVDKWVSCPPCLVIDCLCAYVSVASHECSQAATLACKNRSIRTVGPHICGWLSTSIAIPADERAGPARLAGSLHPCRSRVPPRCHMLTLAGRLLACYWLPQRMWQLLARA